MKEDRDGLAQVAIVVPVLRRPHRVAPLVESIEAATPEPHEIAFVATGGDTPEIDAILEAAAELRSIVLHVLPPNRVGDYARKINHAARVSSTPFLFLGADDLDFRPGWLAAALELMEDPTIFVVGTADLSPTDRARAGEHSTHCLIRRSYVDEFGTIDEPGKLLHEGYAHEYVDDELVGTAKARGAWAFAERSIVEHLHPNWGKAPTDPLYRQQRRRMEASRPLFLRRRGLWETISKSP